MKDVQELMKKFVKIIEGYPEIYNNSLDGYRSRQAEMAWEKLANQVKNDVKEECTVEELKAKWKGIRSSYNRYKNKLLSVSTGVCKKYYLSDYLQFLDPFIKPKGLTNQEQLDRTCEDGGYYADGNENESSNENNPLDDWETDVKPDVIQNIEKEHKIDIIELKSTIKNSKNFINIKSTKLDDCCNYENGNENESLNEYNPLNDWDTDVKPNITQKGDKDHKLDIIELPNLRNNSRDKHDTKKKKIVERSIVDVNEDLQFFKSILPDIKSFTTKEKRKLKMGILQLIDDVENERKRKRPNE